MLLYYHKTYTICKIFYFFFSSYGNFIFIIFKLSFILDAKGR